MRSASTVLLYDVILIITQEARKVKCCHGCGWAIKSKNRQTKRPAINDWSYRSPGRARTYNNSVNSRVLCHWATEDYGIRQWLILPGRVQPSTFSTGELNCCVRDGNRWNLSIIATGNCGYFVSLSCTLTTAHRMILQTVPISSQFSVSDLLSLACVPAACSAFCFFVSCFASLRFRLPSSFSAFKR